jgi:hypothetical protein
MTTEQRAAGDLSGDGTTETNFSDLTRSLTQARADALMARLRATRNQPAEHAGAPAPR